MLKGWVEPVISGMAPSFSTHEFIEQVRELCPADYAHDLAVCTAEHGFPVSLAVLHRAIVDDMKSSGRVRAIGTKESRDVRGNKHQTMIWKRLDDRSGPSRPRERGSLPRPRTPRRRAAPRERKAPPGPPKRLEPLRPLPYPTPGDALAAVRRARGWTMSELAQRAGVSLAAISRWERDERRMSRRTYEAVRKALGVAAARGRKRPRGAKRPR
jgi:DNA-binding XRE family transcriptional regulator